jgi:uncharacterized membrane protein YphA (DoxX/SURF4 family)
LKLIPEHKIYYTLRLASAMCFIGHGAFGIITKPIWCNYFAVFGIGRSLSYQLMPVVGIIDILCGLIILIYPLRATISWLVIWGAITALLRPLSGEPFAEFIERAGNFGSPLALLILSGYYRPKQIRNLFVPVGFDVLNDTKILKQLVVCLQIIVFLLFLGHGWLNLIEKKSLVDQYMALGFVNPGMAAQVIGLLEVIGAFSVLYRPFKPVVLVLFIWKVTSELFYPQYELFEWIERGGSYGAVLALWFALDSVPLFKRNNHFEMRSSFLNRNNSSQLNYSISNNNAYTK